MWLYDFNVNLNSPHLLSIPSGPVELTDGLVHVVRVPVVKAVAEPEPGVGGGPRISSFGELKEGRHLRKIHLSRHCNVRGDEEKGKAACEKGGFVLTTAKYGHHNLLKDSKL